MANRRRPKGAVTAGQSTQKRDRVGERRGNAPQEPEHEPKRSATQQKLPTPLERRFEPREPGLLGAIGALLTALRDFECELKAFEPGDFRANFLLFDSRHDSRLGVTLDAARDVQSALAQLDLSTLEHPGIEIARAARSAVALLIHDSGSPQLFVGHQAFLPRPATAQERHRARLEDRASVLHTFERARELLEPAYQSLRTQPHAVRAAHEEAEAEVLDNRRQGSPDWLTVSQAAYATGWSRGYISKLCTRGKIDYHGDGKQRRIPVDGLRQFYIRGADVQNASPGTERAVKFNRRLLETTEGVGGTRANRSDAHVQL